MRTANPEHADGSAPENHGADGDGGGRPVSATPRENLFISYATADVSFVRWLALKLSACGYRVWWDREQLHGGASFPTDIDVALKTRTFRMLAVLSHYSSRKPSPEAERSLALAIGKERDEPFLVPLNLELKPPELPWNLTNLTFVPFMDSWTVGLRQLLDDLRSACAPCYPSESAELVRANLSRATFVTDAPEDVWLNLFHINDLPLGISRYEWDQDVADDALAGWVHLREGPRACWAFEPPPGSAGTRRPERDQYALGPSRIGDVNLNHVTSSLVRQYVEVRCRTRGLAELPRTRSTSAFYFPDTLPVAARLPFRLPTGRATWLQPVGTRRVWHRKQPEQVRYHLAFHFKVELRRFGAPALQIRPTVHFTTATGRPVDSARNVRRAKAVRRAWFNDKWLARVAAIGSYLADDVDGWKLHPALATTISRVPLAMTSSPSLDETARAAPPAFQSVFMSSMYTACALPLPQVTALLKSELTAR